MGAGVGQDVTSPAEGGLLSSPGKKEMGTACVEENITPLRPGLAFCIQQMTSEVQAEPGEQYRAESKLVLEDHSKDSVDPCFPLQQGPWDPACGSCDCQVPGGNCSLGGGQSDLAVGKLLAVTSRRQEDISNSTPLSDFRLPFRARSPLSTLNSPSVRGKAA